MTLIRKIRDWIRKTDEKELIKVARRDNLLGDLLERETYRTYWLAKKKKKHEEARELYRKIRKLKFRRFF